MLYTDNLNLKIPEENEFYDVNDFNDNAKIIDAAIKKLQDGKADAEDYLKLTGGTITGDLQVKSKHVITSVNGITANNDGAITITIPEQVQPDWNATSGKGQILNKPAIATQSEAETGTDNSAIMTALRTKQAINLVTAIPASANLDNYKTPGKYSCWLSTNAQSLKNNPLSKSETGIILEVIQDGANVFQIIYGTLVRGMYIRRFSSSWNEWKNINNGVKLYDTGTSTGYMQYENGLIMAWTRVTIPPGNKVVNKPKVFRTINTWVGDYGDNSSTPIQLPMWVSELSTNTQDRFKGASSTSEKNAVIVYWIGVVE